MKTRALCFWSIVAVQALFLLGWAGRHEWLRSHGSVILLRTRPVDPRDLLRGDYMTLAYEIGQVPLPGGFTQENGYRKSGSEVWVVLEPKGKYYEAVSASETTPGELRPGQLLARGKVGWRTVDYGIESYFVPEGKGTPHFKTLEVEAGLSATHRLYIRRLLLDGQAYP